MNYGFLAILFLLSGFFMKLSDDFFDENHDLVMASFLGVFCGVFSAIAATSNVDAAYIFIAIPIGNLLALKIDGMHHIITLIVFIIILLVAGIPNLSIVILLIYILAALADEIGHEMISRITENRFLNLFFEYRFVMKIVIFALAVSGVFNIWIFICFLLFEVFYEIAGIVFENLNLKKIS